MRILHTSDWHIGRSFHGHSTLDALRSVLEVLTTQVREHEVDLVLVAGDIFDSATPAAGCYTLLTDTLVGIRDAGAQVVVTSGNHDSAARLGFQAKLLREGIFVVTDPSTVGTPITIDDEDGPVQVYGIPFLEPTLIRHLWTDEAGERLDIRTQHDAIDHAMTRVRADLAVRGGRSVAIAHCFAAGVEPTPHLERDIQQGGLDVVSLSAFDGVDYVALGHIHGRQQLAESVRYAGAPLHYSFGEADKPRGSWLIDMDATGAISAEWLALPIPRRLVTLGGTLDDLLSDPTFAADEDAWVCAQYTDNALQMDPMRRLQARFPFCATVAHTPAVSAAADARSYTARVRAARSDVELVDAFLAHVRGGDAATPGELEIIRDVVDDLTAVKAVA